MKIEQATPGIGAIVTGVDVKSLTDAEWKAMYKAWLDTTVLVVRDQKLSKPDFLAYSARFGRLKPHRVKRTRDPEHPEITLMGVDAKAPGPTSDKLILNRGQGWHTDSPWDQEVCKATQLYALEIPTYGGDTLFANTYAAYDALPQRLKDRIEPLQIEFGYGGRARAGIDLLDPEDQKRPPAVHSMVRVNPETGRKSLYINPHHIVRVQGMSEEEGDRLLAELYWYLLQPNAEYRHKWRAGDIVIWDNRSSIHSAAGGNPSDQRRVHWRTTIMQ
jgi:alpha-ketoglutarate-dependent taurine dioxygenase